MNLLSHRERTASVLIVDFGSQFTQLIARRVRELGIYAEIILPDDLESRMNQGEVKALILSGGPHSVYDRGAPKLDWKGLLKKGILRPELPMLGICYGMQLMGHTLGGKVSSAKTREYGRTRVVWNATGRKAIAAASAKDGSQVVWMSHGDEIHRLPEGFQEWARSENGSLAAMGHQSYPWIAVQFHPEVTHTERGEAVLEYFLFSLARLKADWDLGEFLETTVSHIESQVGPRGRAICALSGGVDSTVAAVVVQQALGRRLKCIFVDNGLMRKGEVEQIRQAYQDGLHLDVQIVKAAPRFLKALAGVKDPERKRKIIGREFIRVFEEKAPQADFLVQGTLYPDVIESLPPPRSGSPVKGHSHTIKSHHNVGGLPARMKMKLIEPLRELFKDEVRQLGARMGVPEQILKRHPFPGPGLAVRVLGAITPERLAVLREVDGIFIEELKRFGLYDKIWQAFAVHLPVQSVGVMGDGRTFENVVALRAVTSVDGMTADWYPFESAFLAHVSAKILNQVKGVNRVVYDVSTKPPSTIEWE